MKKVLCKKWFHVGPEIYFKIGETYDLYSEDDDGVWIITHLKSQNIDGDMIEKFFKTKTDRNYRYLYDYFYTLAELRKIKLKKLSNENK